MFYTLLGDGQKSCRVVAHVSIQTRESSSNQLEHVVDLLEILGHVNVYGQLCVDNHVQVLLIHSPVGPPSVCMGRLAVDSPSFPPSVSYTCPVRISAAISLTTSLAIPDLFEGLPKSISLQISLNVSYHRQQA